MLQPHAVTAAVLVAKIKQIAANQGFDLPIGTKIDGANNVRLCVRDIKRLFVARQAGRLRESRFIKRPVMASFAPRSSEGRNLHLVEIQFPNLMRPGHGDVERVSDELQVPRRV